MNGTGARKLVAVGASLAVLGGGLLVSEGAGARGKASTKVTIQGGGSISGYVKSSNENKCANGRKVKVYRVKNNGDKDLITTDTATANGDKFQWSAGNPGNGKYFAKAKETSQCEGDKSPTVNN